MTAGQIVLWRHGLTDWNATGTYQGQHDVPLNAVGRAQAESAAPYLAALRPVALWASPLGRAQETARALAALTGLAVQTEAGLQEINVGSWVGYTSADAYAEDPGFRADLEAGRDHRRSATGETAMETGERVAAAIRRVAEGYGPEDTIVITTHGMATRMSIACLLGLNYAQSQLLAGPRNCSWAIVEPAQLTGWRLLSYNNVPARRDDDPPGAVDEAW